MRQFFHKIAEISEIFSTNLLIIRYLRKLSVKLTILHKNCVILKLLLFFLILNCTNNTNAVGCIKFTKIIWNFTKFALKSSKKF